MKPVDRIVHDQVAEYDAEAAEVGEEEVLIASLEKDEQQLGPAVKAVIDRSLEDSFASNLELRIRKRNGEIKAICNEHYEEFIGSVENLVTVKLELVDLRQEVDTLNDKVQETGLQVLEKVRDRCEIVALCSKLEDSSKAQSLLENMKMAQNLDSGLEILDRCQCIVQLLSKAKEQVEMKKYFSALKVRRRSLLTTDYVSS